MDVMIKNEVTRSYSSKPTQRSDKPYAESRVFIDFGENVWEHLQNRRNRPYNTLKPLVLAALRDSDVPVNKLRWSRYAGCSMCPCSGGFIIEGSYGKDYYAKVVN